ncbi:unnamed protein product [Enterobius vermicularis]|uniref:Secreted protein n=1 Tax=Enterobius vermicularis TaxID=51028 RepID=A0A0N4VDW7_ENTVE|nr:unnamed protein product [Enterobius vermicularis]
MFPKNRYKKNYKAVLVFWSWMLSNAAAADDVDDDDDDDGDDYDNKKVMDIEPEKEVQLMASTEQQAIYSLFVTLFHYEL